MFDLREEQERVILVGVQENGGANAEESLDELAELASTAGAKVEGRLVQVREAIHPGTYIGKGKLEELKILVRACDATGIICDDELSSIQLKGSTGMQDHGPYAFDPGYLCGARREQRG